MKVCKKVAVVMLAGILAANVYAQQSEKTVESEYLSSVEDIVITELATSEELDNKLVALQYLEAAINDGRTSPDMMVALDSLAGEGITNQSRTNGRLVNNYPQVRAQACKGAYRRIKDYS